MRLDQQQQQAYSAWLQSFCELTHEETGVLVDTIRAMAIILGSELQPKDGKQIIGRGTLESFALLQSLFDGFFERAQSELPGVEARIRMEIVNDGDARKLMQLSQQSAEARGVREDEAAAAAQPEDASAESVLAAITAAGLQNLAGTS